MLKRVKRMLPLLMLWLLLLQVNIVAFAAETTGDVQEITHYDTGNAVNDILRNDRFSGAISSIQVITDFVDIWFIRVISVISFFIISAALLKNVCAGAYVSNDKFWDQVDEAHKANEAISLAQIGGFITGGGWQQASTGSVKKFLFGIIPNIKALTDFEDADIEPKAYFMRSIPQMIACVCIGIFIYNGYYRDTAAQVGQMGSVIIDKTLNSVDPESLVNTVFNSTSWPDFPWKGDQSTQGKMYQELCNTTKGLVNSNYTGLNSASAKAQVVANISTKIQNVVGGSTGELFPDGSEYMYTISGIKSYVSVESATDPKDTLRVISGTPMESDVTYMLALDMQSIVSGVTTDISADKAVGYISFTMKIGINDGTGGLSGQTAKDLEKTHVSSYPQSEPVNIAQFGAKWSGNGDGSITLTNEITIPIASLHVTDANTGSALTTAKVSDSDLNNTSGKQLVKVSGDGKNLVISAGASYTVDPSTNTFTLARIAPTAGVILEVKGTTSGGGQQKQPGT